MRIEQGFWLSLTNQHRQRVVYQVATDNLTEAEFLSLWEQAGRVMLRELSAAKEGSLEYSIRAQKTETHR